MDITPIYELRARLRAAAIAGTNLLAEDFRLKRAAEAIQPLEAASPVFAKIGGLTRGLLSAGQETGEGTLPEKLSPEKFSSEKISSEKLSREGLLLEALSLIDALLCTQGQVAAEGEFLPLPIENTGSTVNNASYSDVKALLDALTNSGGGRYSYLQEMHEKRPELFEDYRVKPALAQALGASYAELAEEAKKWLQEMGESVLPLLEKGFDPKGKKEMVRRVEVIDAIAGAKANDFYLRQLPDAEKEVRQALIYALRHSPENEEALISFTKTEKGKTKRMAYYALACQESDTARVCVEKLAEKNPEEALLALSASGTDWASALVQKGLYGILDRFEERMGSSGKFLEKTEEIGKDLDALNRHLEALKGKSGSTVCDCVRRTAALAAAPKMQRLRLEGRIDGTVYNKDKEPTLMRLLARRMQEYLMLRPEKELMDLAQELYDTYKGVQSGEALFQAAVLAKLLREEDCALWLQEELDRDKNTLLPAELAEALRDLRWGGKGKGWVIGKWIYNPALETNSVCTRKVRQQVKGDFSRLLMGERIGGNFPEGDQEKERFGELNKGNLLGKLFSGNQKEGRPGSLKRWGDRFGTILGNCIPDGDAEYESAVMEFLYELALKGGGSANYFCYQLKQHGFQKCQGLAVQHFKGKGPYHLWEVKSFLSSLPGSGEAKREEGRELLNQIREGRLDVRLSSMEREQLEAFVESMV